MDGVRVIRTVALMKTSSAATGLKRLRERSKMSVREVAAALGKPTSTYASYEDKFKKPYLPLDLINALVPIFDAKGIPPEEVLALAGVKNGTVLSANPSKSGEEPLTATELNIQHFPRDLPILGSAACGEDGLFEFNGQTLDHARRPPRLKNVQGAYALYAAGLSMSPWREPGQLVYVHPHQPAKVGDYVVVQLHPEKPGEPPLAYIKKLVRRTEKDLKLLQYSPREELVVPMRKVKTIHRVIDWDELLGL